MKSYTTESFRKAFGHLPQHIQRQSREAYRLFLQNRAIRVCNSSKSTLFVPFIPSESLVIIAP